MSPFLTAEARFTPSPAFLPRCLPATDVAEREIRRLQAELKKAEEGREAALLAANKEVGGSILDVARLICVRCGGSATAAWLTKAQELARRRCAGRGECLFKGALNGIPDDCRIAAR